LLCLGKPSRAAALRMIERGIPVALATDFTPGTSPTPNLSLVMTLGVSQLGLSASEALVAATVNGASALGLAVETGQIASGYAADLALFDVHDYREIAYWYGDNRCRATWTRGKACYPSNLGLP